MIISSCHQVKQKFYTRIWWNHYTFICGLYFENGKKNLFLVIFLKTCNILTLLMKFFLQTLEITRFCLLFSGSKNPASTTGNPMHASMSRSQPGGGSSQPGQPQHGLQQPHQQGQHHGQQQRLQNNQQQRNMSLPHMQQQQQKSSRSSQQQHRHSSGRNSYHFRFISQISVSDVFPTIRIFSWKYSGTFVELQQHRHSSGRNSYYSWH